MIDVLIPTADRPYALAVTLAGLAGQDSSQRVLIADQSSVPVAGDRLVSAMLDVLRAGGWRVDLVSGRQRRGIAEQRAFLLSRATAEQVLLLDDDVWLQPWAMRVLGRMLRHLECGFVGMPVIGASFLDDVRPHQWSSFEAWPGRVAPERVVPGDAAWRRHELHNAANPWHLAARHRATVDRPIAYKVAWIGGCVLFDRAALCAVGGFDFWTDLPVPHVGEDVVVQVRALAAFGGAGVLPSGAYHLELPTTLPDRRFEARDCLADEVR